MNKIVKICCSLVLGLSFCKTYAQQNAPATGMSLLWKISGKGLQQPSYLFGTIHVICPDDYIWTPAMQKAFDSCKKVAFEMDMDDPELQRTLTQSMLLQDGKTLKAFYTEEQYTALDEAATKNGIPLSALQQFHPFALVPFLYMKAITCSIPDSYEGNITKLAQKQEKEILGLETVEEQIAVINSLGADTVAQQLLTILNDIDSLKSSVSSMISFYKQQNLPALYELIVNSPDYKNALDDLLYKRNKKWIPAIERLAQQQPTFIAVGVGHLWGDLGVIRLLQEAGYNVEMVR